MKIQRAVVLISKMPNLSLDEILAGVRHARGLGLEVGVSFFRDYDAIEFCKYSVPDFFKVPSAEALNFQLI